MKLLIIQQAGLHAKNREFRESLNFKRAFDRNRNLGVDCIVWGHLYDNFSIPFDEIIKGVDVILLLENYKTFWIPDLTKYNVLRLFWSIDAHCVFDEHVITCNSQKIHKLLCSTYGYRNAFARAGHKNFQWFPNAYASDLIMPLGIQKLIDVGFCGSLLNRGAWISRLQHDVGLKFDRLVLGSGMVQAINSYKIHWNRNLADDINCRTFETLGCGTFLLTNETDRLAELFKIGEHLVTYTTKEDCIDKIKYYLSHDSERLKITAEGWEYASIHHTYDSRAKDLVRIINEI